jgi:hypothetical protein
MPGDSHLLLTPRHPLRQRLPRPVLHRIDDDGDLKLFVLSFTAFFVAIYCFIA